MENFCNDYKILLLKKFRSTNGVTFNEIHSVDIPIINGIDTVNHEPNVYSPPRIEDKKRPWYKHNNQSDTLLIIQGTRHIDLYNPITRKKTSFIITPNKLYINNKLYYNGPAMLSWNSGIFHRTISGSNGSKCINFATRTKDFDIKTEFNIYDLNEATGEAKCIRQGSEDQMNDQYYTDDNDNILKNLLQD